MEELSTSEQLRRFNFALNGLLKGISPEDNAEQKLLDKIRLLLGQVKGDYHGFEYADSGREQAIHAAKLQQRLKGLHDTILKASENNVFSPIDVAELSTAIERLQERIGR